MTQNSEPSAPLLEVPSTKPNLLVLDDEAAVRKLLARLLAREGYAIHEAARVDEAYAAAASLTHLDVFVTDANIDGSDATTEITRFRELYPRLAVVLISGCEPERDRAEALAKLGVKFLAKPFSQADLRATIDLALRHGSASSAVVPVVAESDAAAERAR